MEKVAILSIATGKYISLFENLKNSLFEKFLPEYSKTILLFTDSTKYKSNETIFIKNITNLPWPLNTLLRFNYFKSIENQLSDYDFVYYIDSDTIVYDIIDEEIIPTSDQIIAVKHPWHENGIGIYEVSNNRSTAYVDSSKLTVGNYCQGCFFGSRSSKFIEMTSVLNENINKDLRNNTIALWHDESHLNKYLLNNSCKRLHSGYAQPTLCDDRCKNPLKILHKNYNSFPI